MWLCWWWMCQRQSPPPQSGERGISSSETGEGTWWFYLGALVLFTATSGDDDRISLGVISETFRADFAVLSGNSKMHEPHVTVRACGRLSVCVWECASLRGSIVFQSTGRLSTQCHRSPKSLTTYNISTAAPSAKLRAVPELTSANVYD
jgi:hypothetical protein